MLLVSDFWHNRRPLVRCAIRPSVLVCFVPVEACRWSSGDGSVMRWSHRIRTARTRFGSVFP